MLFSASGDQVCFRALFLADLLRRLPFCIHFAKRLRKGNSTSSISQLFCEASAEEILEETMLRGLVEDLVPL